MSVINFNDGGRDQLDFDQHFPGAEPTLVWDAPGLDVEVSEVNGISVSNTVGEQLSDWGTVEAGLDLSPAGEGFSTKDEDAGLLVAYRRVRPMTATVTATCGAKTWTGTWKTYTREGTSLDNCGRSTLLEAAEQACKAYRDQRGG
ncbi:MAG: hypothetical protein AAGC49_13875 [Brevundimonas sp.]